MTTYIVAHALNDPLVVSDVAAVASLVGVTLRVWDPDADWSPELLLVTAGHGDADGQPSLTVGVPGDGADITLPTDAPLLAQVFSDLGKPQGNGDVQITSPITVVAGWRGGVGTSQVASSFAAILGAVLLDASGHPPLLAADDSEVFTWTHIDHHDPPLPGPLLEALPIRGGVRTLAADAMDPASPTDLRVLAAANQLQQAAVIDAGVWTPGVESLLAGLWCGGHPTRLVMVGNSDAPSAIRLAGVLAGTYRSCLPHLLLSVGKTKLPLRRVGEDWDIPVGRWRPRRVRTAVNLWGDNHE